MLNRSIVVHYAEIALKGKNQREFRRRLQENLQAKLARMGLKWRVQETRGLLIIKVPEGTADSFDHVLNELAKVFGISWLSPADTIPRTAEGDHLELARDRLLKLASSTYHPDKTFVVRVNRADKTWNFTSPQYEKQLGDVVIENTPWRKVSLRKPDITFNLDFRTEGTFVYGERIRGPGGLPVGSSGRVLALLSGGIDSPVAAWLMAKRGCRVDFVHFVTSPLAPSEVEEYSVIKLARHLNQYTLYSRLVLVPYTYFDLAMLRETSGYELVLFRRFMARVAERLALRSRAQSLVSGDNLSQVASQTLSNLVSTSSAIAMPILRPLIAYDKLEIMALAEKIGTYQLSQLPYKDCCALVSRHPKTRSRHYRLEAIEAPIMPDYDKLIEQTLADATVINLSH